MGLSEPVDDLDEETIILVSGFNFVLGHYATAYQTLQPLVRYVPAVALMTAASALQAGKIKPAAQLVKRALRYNRKDPVVHLYLVLVSLLQQKPTAAQTALKKLRLLKPRQVKVLGHYIAAQKAAKKKFPHTMIQVAKQLAAIGW
jgi:predicted Zn-dependent protease